MDTTQVLQIIGIIMTSVVGFILYIQIKSQSTIISQYKGFAEAIDPKKALMLKDAEIEQLVKLADNDISRLKGELFEIANYVDSLLTSLENNAKFMGHPEAFTRQHVIDKNLPKCSKILSEIHSMHQLSSKQPSA